MDQKTGAGDEQVGRGRHHQGQHHHLDIFGRDALALELLSGAKLIVSSLPMVRRETTLCQ